MAAYTFKIVSVCDGGEHIRVRVLEDGVSLGVKTLNRTDIINDDTPLVEVLEFLIKKILKNSGATTAAARKKAIEGVSIIL